MRHRVDIISLLFIGICTVLGCESNKQRAAVPQVELPSTEQVQMRVQLTARESVPPLQG